MACKINVPHVHFDEGEWIKPPDKRVVRKNALVMFCWPSKGILETHTVKIDIPYEEWPEDDMRREKNCVDWPYQA